MPKPALVQVQPVTPARLPDLEKFSLAHGKFRYCSCMRWRLASADYKRSTKESRVAKLEALVQEHTPVGLLAYIAGTPVGWCSVAPRSTYAALERYKALPRLDAVPVWAVVCFFIDSAVRRQGVTLALLNGAVAYAKAHKAKAVEGYPVEPGSGLYTYMGSPATFKRAGFKDVTPPGQARLVMRYTFA